MSLFITSCASNANSTFLQVILLHEIDISLQEQFARICVYWNLHFNKYIFEKIVTFMNYYISCCFHHLRYFRAEINNYYLKWVIIINLKLLSPTDHQVIGKACWTFWIEILYNWCTLRNKAQMQKCFEIHSKCCIINRFR